jgi:Fe-Mn family superoxide dismutase
MKSLNIVSESLVSRLLGEETQPETKFFINEMKTIGIDKLPYGYASLRRFIDPETMKFHYQKHYKGYVKKLNSALRKKDYGDVELENIVKQISKYNTTIRNNAGGAFNHALFWKMLSPTPQKPSGEVFEKIVKQFGTYRNFKTKFEEISRKRFGSGWCWLVLTDTGRLKVMPTSNQDNPLMNIINQGGFPLLGLDLWEHAYYLKYQNKRDEYIENFWEVINWEFVNELYKSKTEKKLNESISSKKLLYENVSDYSDIFSNNKNVLWTYRRCIDNTLKTVLSDKWYENNQYSEGSSSGIYGLEQEGRSVINKLNTNYIGFKILVDDLNVVLTKLNKPTLNFIGVTPSQQVQEINKFCEYLSFFGERIFNGSKTLDKIMLLLNRTHKKGGELEEYVAKKINKEFGEGTAVVVGSLGSKEDFAGTDLTVNFDNKIQNAQVKPILSMEVIDGFYNIKIKGFVKKFNTDLLIFSNINKEVYIFKNKTVAFSSSMFKIPTQDLIYTVN